MLKDIGLGDVQRVQKRTGRSGFDQRISGTRSAISDWQSYDHSSDRNAQNSNGLGTLGFMKKLRQLKQGARLLSIGHHCPGLLEPGR